ncbi:MAG TPA: YceI family protein [Terriglobales bacterium]|nr:YceI family protein [Terriglobales bacterium]
MKTLLQFSISAITVLWLAGAALAQAQPNEVGLNFVPAKTRVNFTLGATLHTVHGAFDVKRGAVHFDPATNKLTGEVLVDAASGLSGSDGRDKKMHKQVLESSRYPDIVFRPDRVEGRFAALGASTVQVHGIFVIHGAEHEITIPVRVQMDAGYWTITSHFTLPYVEWGMKNPSTFVLRVDPSVDIDIQASGETP